MAGKGETHPSKLSWISKGQERMEGMQRYELGTSGCGAVKAEAPLADPSTKADAK